MLTKTQIESKGFSHYRSSGESPSNPIGQRDDYVSLAKVGEAEYLVLIEYYDDGKLKVKDFWNDPILFPEYYYVGVVLTQQELDTALEETRFDTFETIEFDKLWYYK